VAIWLLLILGILSGVTGVILFQDIGGDVMEGLHEATSNAMLAVVFIHIAGVVVNSLMHRENLVRSMITVSNPQSQMKASAAHISGWVS